MMNEVEETNAAWRQNVQWPEASWKQTVPVENWPSYRLRPKRDPPRFLNVPEASWKQTVPVENWPSYRLRPKRDPPRFLNELLTSVTLRQWCRDMLELESESSTRKKRLPYLEELVERERKRNSDDDNSLFYSGYISSDSEVSFGLSLCYSDSESEAEAGYISSDSDVSFGLEECDEEESLFYSDSDSEAEADISENAFPSEEGFEQEEASPSEEGFEQEEASPSEEAEEASPSEEAEEALPSEEAEEASPSEEAEEASPSEEELEGPCYEEQLGSTIVNGFRRSHRIAVPLGSYLDMSGRRRSVRLRRRLD